jgi:predicted GIY-YIG superfamily endonuclease
MNTHNADLKLPLIDLEADNTATGGKQELINSVQPERLSEGDNMYCIYWIHLPEYTFDKGDELNFGYIGLTSNFKERMKSHKKNKNKTHFTDAIKKYGWKNLNKVIMYENLSLKDALYIEHCLRPKNNIGWNLQMGGILGVEKEWYDIPENKRKHQINTSLKTIEGIAKNDTFEKRSQRAKLSRLNNKNSYKNVSVGSNNGKALLNEKQVKHIKILIQEGVKDRVIAEMYDVKSYVIAFIRKGKTWKHIVCDSPDHE